MSCCQRRQSNEMDSLNCWSRGAVGCWKRPFHMDQEFRGQGQRSVAVRARSERAMGAARTILQFSLRADAFPLQLIAMRLDAHSLALGGEAEAFADAGFERI